MRSDRETRIRNLGMAETDDGEQEII